MIYGYIRVSTDKQNTENQRFQLEQFAQAHHLHIERWIEETISSTIPLNKRKLGRLLPRLKKEDILIAAELSRLGRNLLQIMSILHLCMSKEVEVWTIKDNYRLGSDIQSKVLAFAFGLSAEIERRLISERTKEALNRLRSKGTRLGRPKGRRNTHHRLDGKEDLIFTLYQTRMPKVQIARRLRVDVRLIRNILKTEIRREKAPTSCPKRPAPTDHCPESDATAVRPTTRLYYRTNRPLNTGRDRLNQYPK